jgi:hypothetical protein
MDIFYSSFLICNTLADWREDLLLALALDLELALAPVLQFWK